MKSKIANTRVKNAKNLKSEKVERNTGNVFADLGFHDAEERIMEGALATKISQLIESRGWTHVQTAERVGLEQPKISNLVRGGAHLMKRASLRGTTPTPLSRCTVGPLTIS